MATTTPQSPMFKDTSGYRFYDAMNVLQWKAVMDFASGSATPDKFRCLAPVCGNPDRQIEKKKAFALTVILNMIGAGYTVPNLPDMCSCDSLGCMCQEELLALTHTTPS